jgi:hypothetical protein
VGAAEGDGSRLPFTVLAMTSRISMSVSAAMLAALPPRWGHPARWNRPSRRKLQVSNLAYTESRS